MAERIVGQGSFGVVFQAKCLETGETVAIKKVLQNKRYKNRELQTMRLLDHPNVVSLKHCFFSTTEKDELYRNLVLEYVPETVHRMIKHYNKLNQRMPMIYVKLYAYQIFRALSYIHRSIGVCHRDIKPQNLLVNPHTHQVKLCDFGSAKVLVKGEPNISYICSRYYRAPELVFGATEYSTAIDIWSSGCVVAEMMLGKPLFPGESGVDQLIEIIKVLGTPTREEIKCMNPNYTEFKFPQIKAHPWHKIFHKRMPPEAVDLVSRLLQYSPNLRCTALDALIHPFFDELRYPNTRLPTGRFLPPLFNFKSHGINPKTNKLNGKKDLLFNELDFTSVVITKDEYSISKPYYGSTKTTSKSKFEEPKEKGDGTNLEDQCAALGSLASIKDDSSITSKGSTGKNKTVAKNELSPQEVPSASVLPLTSSNTSAVEAEREIQVENESISGVTMPKSSLRSSGSKKPGLSVTWADEKLDSCGSRDLCEVSGLGGDGSDNNADNMLRFASAEACAMAMSQAAEAIASGDSDVADAVSEAGVIILPCPHDGDDGESTEDPDVLELEDPLNWPSKSGIPHSDLFDPEDSWYDAPPEEFGLTEGLLNTMSFIDPLPAFRVKQWQVITFVFLDALSICRIPTLIPHMTNRTILLHKVLIVAQITAEEYEVMKDFIMPLGRAPNFSTQSGA